MTIGVVIINHNSQGTVLRSIQSIKDQNLDIHQIVVVDNDSKDDDMDKVRTHFPDVKVVQLELNAGPSVSRNAGINLLNTDLILTLDDDIYLGEGALQTMITTLQNTGADIVLPRLVFFDNKELIQFDGAALHFIGTLLLNHVYRSVGEFPPRVNLIHAFAAACLLMKRESLAKTGWYDEDYFFYFEDLEFSYRISALGLKIYCDEYAVAFHEPGAGTDGLSYREGGMYPARRAYLTIQNRWQTMAIHYQFKTILLLSPILFIYEVLTVLEMVRRGWLMEYIRAFRFMTRMAPSILKKRKRQQLRRRLKDGSILSGGEMPFARGFIDRKFMFLINALNFVFNTYWNLVKRWL